MEDCFAHTCGCRPALSIHIARKDHQEPRKLVKGGVQELRVELRALALLQLAENASAPQIAKVIPLTSRAIRGLGHRYQQTGLVGAFYELQRPGAAEVLDNNKKRRIIAMVCSDPPQGRARWPIRLVAEEGVKRETGVRRWPGDDPNSAAYGGGKMWCVADFN